ncbi:uncharacterized protein LOC121049267 [Rosa chinensis]|uniref:uncharacterized protein LOC121049267 n=1 Tax=Rosa chinensis TaxID=74649 RepID=UPI001AD8B8A1|nr:uncharacterized protein LOC121049267 [Rosa chinensis]
MVHREAAQHGSSGRCPAVVLHVGLTHEGVIEEGLRQKRKVVEIEGRSSYIVSTNNIRALEFNLNFRARHGPRSALHLQGPGPGLAEEFQARLRLAGNRDRPKPRPRLNGPVCPGFQFYIVDFFIPKDDTDSKISFHNTNLESLFYNNSKLNTYRSTQKL